MEIPQIGLGTWGMGGRYERDSTNAAVSVKIIQEALKIGYQLFDVAELYGEGLTEEIVGKGIENFRREDLFLISKVWKDHLRSDDITKAIDGSLKRLGTDYLDLYLVHWPNPEIPFSETMPAMENLIKAGKTKAIGVSNFSVEQIQEAQKYLANTFIYANQIEYNLGARGAEDSVIPYCLSNNIKVISYRPLAKGKITFSQIPEIEKISTKYQKTPVQIFLKWLCFKNTIPIPKASSPDHLRENFDIFNWELSAEDAQIISNLRFDLKN